MSYQPSNLRRKKEKLKKRTEILGAFIQGIIQSRNKSSVSNLGIFLAMHVPDNDSNAGVLDGKDKTASDFMKYLQRIAWEEQISEKIRIFFCHDW